MPKGVGILSVGEILLLGAALSMDAFAVAVVSGITAQTRVRQALLLACAFGCFQGLMPLLGYFTGSAFAVTAGSFAPWLSFGLLAMVGGKMLLDSLQGNSAAQAILCLTLHLVLLQAVATSIDALAVGVALAADPRRPNIWQAAGLIAACTFSLSLLGVGLGRRLGRNLADKAGVLGGLILIGIGIKMLIC